MAKTSLIDATDSELEHITRFKNRLRRSIAQAGYRTSAEFCNAAGISQDSYRKYMAGKSLPGAICLMRMSDALGVPVDWLLGYSTTEIVVRYRTLATPAASPAAKPAAVPAASSGDS